jgi:hypothetical protein
MLIFEGPIFIRVVLKINHNLNVNKYVNLKAGGEFFSYVPESNKGTCYLKDRMGVPVSKPGVLSGFYQQSENGIRPELKPVKPYNL